MRWYLDALKKYAVFGGRARRKEYWMYTLFNSIFSIAAYCIDSAAGSPIIMESSGGGFGFLLLLYGLAVFIPGLAVCVRRLHDTGKSGWCLLLPLIPILGSIFLFIFLVQDGQPGENQYGPDPKTVPSTAPASAPV